MHQLSLYLHSVLGYSSLPRTLDCALRTSYQTAINTTSVPPRQTIHTNDYLGSLPRSRIELSVRRAGQGHPHAVARRLADEQTRIHSTRQPQPHGPSAYNDSPIRCNCDLHSSSLSVCRTAPLSPPTTDVFCSPHHAPNPRLSCRKPRPRPSQSPPPSDLSIRLFRLPLPNMDPR